MIQVELSQATFERLQRLAVPLVDTIETVINRLLDRSEGAPPPRAAAASAPSVFDPASPPPLTHTKVVAIRFDGVPMAKDVNWNGLLRETVKRLPQDLRTPESLRRLVVVNFVAGRKDDEGYRYLEEANISLQGQDARDAARAAFHIARQRGWALEVEFVWRDKPAAAHPGQLGVLRARQ